MELALLRAVRLLRIAVTHFGFECMLCAVLLGHILGETKHSFILLVLGEKRNRENMIALRLVQYGRFYAVQKQFMSSIAKTAE